MTGLALPRRAACNGSGGAPDAPTRRSSVTEVTAAGHHHRDARAVGGGDHLAVAPTRPSGRSRDRVRCLRGRLRRPVGGARATPRAPPGGGGSQASQQATPEGGTYGGGGSRWPSRAGTVGSRRSVLGESERGFPHPYGRARPSERQCCGCGCGRSIGQGRRGRKRVGALPAPFAPQGQPQPLVPDQGRGGDEAPGTRKSPRFGHAPEAGQHAQQRALGGVTRDLRAGRRPRAARGQAHACASPCASRSVPVTVSCRGGGRRRFR